MPKTIPDRWEPYKACGSIIEGTNIICFKVPLRTEVQRNVANKWDIKRLLNKIPRLGAVIDLTNTTRYYNPQDLQNAGVHYKKILIPGREIPPENKVTEFMKAIDHFMSLRSDMVIGVHCTHGLNRTGYLVCRFMRDRLQIPPAVAIKRFETARGYHIERENYIANIVGNVPPPPDFNKETALKPVAAIETSWRSRDYDIKKDPPKHDFRSFGNYQKSNDYKRRRFETSSNTSDWRSTRRNFDRSDKRDSFSDSNLDYSFDY